MEVVTLCIAAWCDHRIALPIMSVRRSGMVGDTGPNVALMLEEVATWSVWYPALAAAIGLLLAITAWGEDHRQRHVYALSLPVPRWNYALLRFAAGALLLAAPIIATWAGALAAAAAVDVPLGMRTYPHALALRFALAAFVAYAVFFAVSSGTTRTAAWVLGLVGGLFVLEVLLAAAGSGLSPIAWFFARLTGTAGPLEVFAGPWMLIDV
jgi:hypothetical protein